jgi:hypothetical protein
VAARSTTGVISGSGAAGGGRRTGLRVRSVAARVYAGVGGRGFGGERGFEPCRDVVGDWLVVEFPEFGVDLFERGQQLSRVRIVGDPAPRSSSSVSSPAVQIGELFHGNLPAQRWLCLFVGAT